MNKFKLRPLEEKDAARMLEWLHDENVTKYLTISGKNSTLEDALRFIRNAKDESVNIHRAIVDENDCYLGTVSLKNIDAAKKEAEYAITMHPSAMGTGAASAASRMIADFAFEEKGFNRVYLNVLRMNERAVRFYDRLGYQYTHSTHVDFEGEQRELVWYDVIRKV